MHCFCIRRSVQVFSWNFQYLLIAFLFNHSLISTFSVSKSTVVVLPIAFAASINRSLALLNSQTSPCYKHWNHTDVFHCQRKKFVQTILCYHCLNEFWLHWISGPTKMHLMEATPMVLQLLCHTYQVHSSSVYWLKSRKPDGNSRCEVAFLSLRLFFYHQLARGPAYTHNTMTSL